MLTERDLKYGSSCTFFLSFSAQGATDPFLVGELFLGVFPNKKLSIGSFQLKYHVLVHFLPTSTVFSICTYHIISFFTKVGIKKVVEKSGMVVSSLPIKSTSHSQAVQAMAKSKELSCDAHSELSAVVPRSLILKHQVRSYETHETYLSGAQWLCP